MALSVLPACMSVHYVHGWCPWKLDKNEDYEPPCGYWELNPGPPEEQPVFCLFFFLSKTGHYLCSNPDLSGTQSRPGLPPER